VGIPAAFARLAARRPQRIGSQELAVLVANTVAVLTSVPEQRGEWRHAVTQLQQAAGDDQVPESALFQAILALLDGAAPTLLPTHPYAATLAAIQAGLQEAAAAPAGMSQPDSLRTAVRAFVNAADWATSRQVVEDQQAVLLQPEVDSLFAANIAQAQATGDTDIAETLEVHRDVLRDCHTLGIPAAFARLDERRRSTAAPALPFAADLIPRTIAALLGTPQERLALAPYLHAQATQAPDDSARAFIIALQTALFGGDLATLGADLAGPYPAAWAQIVNGVQLLDQIVHNTLAVLGPAAAQRSAWGTQLNQLRNQATADANRPLVALLDAVLGLLDAGGDPTGLGTALQGGYARAWQQLLKSLIKEAE